MYLGGGVVEVVMFSFSVLEVGARWMGAVEKKRHLPGGGSRR
jgi:hypothetical protein